MISAKNYFPSRGVGIRNISDYSPFGVLLPERTVENEFFRRAFNGMETDPEVKGMGNSYDFGARMLDPRIGRWLTLDNYNTEYPHQSPYAHSSNSPIYKRDMYGDWDIVVHAYTDRGKMGYGIAIVTDNDGKVVGEFLVRVEGSAGVSARRAGKTDKNLRSITNGDTPTGVYDIGVWMPQSSDDQEGVDAYGANHRLQLTGESGEIMNASKDRQTTIRLHGGRQVEGREGSFDTDNFLKYTHGCLRIDDDDILSLYNLTQQLEEKDPTETSGKLTVKDDLVKVGNVYYTSENAKQVKKAIYFIKWADKEIEKGTDLSSGNIMKYFNAIATIIQTESVNDKIKESK